MREDILTMRREKLALLTKERGTAYPENAPRTHTNEEATTQFDVLSTSEENVSLVGRIRSLRVMGKIAFCHLEDGSGQMQGFFSLEMLGEESFRLFKSTVETGDFLSITGTLFLTKQNEKSVHVTTWQML
ncbi:MAG: lysine--tRNA ligase, partial [Candidatus Moranbacteria bacterium CG17_big_fil_post_rev_8_21_14_2_50_41_107]